MEDALMGNPATLGYTDAPSSAGEYRYILQSLAGTAVSEPCIGSADEHSGSHAHGNEIASIEGMKGHGFMLRFEGTHDEQFAQVKNAIIDIHHTVRGNGNPGLEAKFYQMVSRFDNLIARLDTQERERDRYRQQRAKEEKERYEQDKARMTRIGLLLTICLVLLGCITAYITVREARMHSLFPTAMIHSQQDAGASVPNLERNLYNAH